MIASIHNLYQYALMRHPRMPLGTETLHERKPVSCTDPEVIPSKKET